MGIRPDGTFGPFRARWSKSDGLLCMQPYQQVTALLSDIKRSGESYASKVTTIKTLKFECIFDIFKSKSSLLSSRYVSQLPADRFAMLSVFWWSKTHRFELHNPNSGKVQAILQLPINSAIKEPIEVSVD